MGSKSFYYTPYFEYLQGSTDDLQVLSICLVHYYAEEHLETFLKSLEACPYLGTFEIIVINNGGSELLQEKFPSVKWIRAEKNFGFGGGLNRAVKESQGEFVFFGNCDLIAKPSSFDRLLEFLKAHLKAGPPRRAGIVGPKLVFEGSGQVQDSARRFPTVFDLLKHRLGFKPRRYLMMDQDKTKPVQCDWLVGAALLMRRDLFLQLGGFDERFFLFFEDTDLCRRVKEAGYDVWYCPDSVFTHTSIRLSESKWPLMWLFKKTFWHHVGSAFKYFAKWMA